MILARHNLKHSKGVYLSFTLITALVTAVLSLVLSLTFQTLEAYEARFEALHTGDVNFYTAEEKSGLEASIEALDHVRTVETCPVLIMQATVKDFKDSDFDMHTVFYNLENARRMNQYEIIETAETEQAAYVYLPEYMKLLGGFRAGEKIEYRIGDKIFSYPIRAIISEMEYGNYGNGLIGVYLSDAAYRELAASEHEMQEYSLSVKEGVDYERLKEEIRDVTDREGVPLLALKDRESNRQSRTMTTKLILSVLLLFSLIVFGLSLLLNSFRIKSTIEEEMVHMGVLKALGYRSRQIIRDVIFPYALSGVLAGILGGRDRPSPFAAGRGALGRAVRLPF